MIGKLLGHARIETTARYAHLARDSERESAACIRTVRPIIFYKFNHDPAAAGHLVTALGDQSGTTLTWVMGTAIQASKGSGGQSLKRYSNAQPLRSRRRQPRLRWNTAACARAKPAGPEPFSRLFRYRAQSPSFPSRQ